MTKMNGTQDPTDDEQLDPNSPDGGDGDGTQDAPITKNNPDEPEQGNPADAPDGEGKDGTSGEADEDGQEEDGQTDGEKGEEPVTEDPRDVKIKALEDQIAEIKRTTKPDADKPRERSDKEWAALETQTGINREGISYFENQLQEGLIALGRVIMSQLNNQTSSSQLDRTIQEMSKQKEYADINKYKTDVEEFLSMFAPETRAKKELVQKALIYARGKNAGKAVKRIVNSTEKNKRVATNGRPSSPTNKTTDTTFSKKNGKVDLRLSPQERAAFLSFGRHSFKTEEEYAKSLPRNQGAA